MCHTKMRWKRETHAVRGREDGEGRHTTVTEREERGGRHTQSEEEEIVEGDTHTHTHPNTHTHMEQQIVQGDTQSHRKRRLRRETQRKRG